MASNQYLSRLGFILALDSSEFLADVEKAQREWKDFSNEAKRDSAAAAKAIIELEVATKNYGKTLTAVDRMQTEIQTGKYAQAMEWEKKLLMQKAQAYDAVANSATKAGKVQSGLTAQQSAALGYQTTDIVTSLLGGQNPLMVLIQQGGQLRDQFGGFKPLFAGIASAISPVGLAVTALGGTVLGLGYAMYQGSEEAKKLNAAIALTGNYAGTTSAQFDALSVSIAARYNVSIGSTKDAMQLIIGTGQFTRQSLSSVAELVTSFSKISGDSAAVVAEKLIPSLDGTASSAAKLNNQYHFLTYEQYKQIEGLEKQGKYQEAITLTADAFNQKLKDQQKALGPLAEMWKDASTGISNYYENIKKFLSEGDSVATQLDKAKLHYGSMKQSYGEGSEQAINAARAYYDLLNKFADAALEAEEKAAKADVDSKKIKFKQQYGQQLIDLDAKIAEEGIKEKYAIEAKGLDAISQLEKKKAMEDALAVLEIKRKVAKDPQIGGVLERAAKAEADRKKAEAALQQSNISRDELENYRKKAIAEQDSIDKERERLTVYKENLLAADSDLQIALSRLKTEQEIADIMQNKKIQDPADKELAADRLRQIQKSREAVINQAAELKMLQDMNQSVFNNMGSAIDNFVRNGKLSFKDLTRSIIQDLISIAMKAQMMAMFKGFNFFNLPTGGGSISGPTSSVSTWEPAGFASGGEPPVGIPSIVGENGPELFIPHTAGTIIPNGQFSSSSSASPTVNYNGPYIANMSAIDTQSAMQFLAKNKQSVWAVYQSANRSIPVTR
jgi:phage-related minor tail protein